MRPLYTTFVAACLLTATPARADDPKYEYGDVEKHKVDEKKPTVVHANMTAGLVWAEGNTHSLGFTGSASLSVKHWHNELSFSGGGSYIKTGTSKYGPGGPLTGEATSARNGLVKGRYDRYFYQKNTVFASFQSSGDQFAGYWYRIEPQVGYSRLFFKSIHQVFRGELGYDYTLQHNVGWNADAFPPGTALNPKFTQYHSGRLFLFYENKFTPWASFTEGLEMIEAFNHLQAFRLNSLTSLSSTIYKNISLKINFKLTFNNEPPTRSPPTNIDPLTMMPYVLSGSDTHFEKVDTQLDLVLAVTFL